MSNWICLECLQASRLPSEWTPRGHRHRKRKEQTPYWDSLWSFGTSTWVDRWRSASGFEVLICCDVCKPKLSLSLSLSLSRARHQHQHANEERVVFLVQDIQWPSSKHARTLAPQIMHLFWRSKNSSHYSLPIKCFDSNRIAQVKTLIKLFTIWVPAKI